MPADSNPYCNCQHIITCGDHQQPRTFPHRKRGPLAPFLVLSHPWWAKKWSLLLKFPFHNHLVFKGTLVMCPNKELKLSQMLTSKPSFVVLVSGKDPSWLCRKTDMFTKKTAKELLSIHSTPFSTVMLATKQPNSAKRTFKESFTRFLKIAWASHFQNKLKKVSL